MRELERQQKEQEENADRQFDMLAEPTARTPRSAAAAAVVSATNSRFLCSRRSSEDSLEEGGGSLRDMRVRVGDRDAKKYRMSREISDEGGVLRNQMQALLFHLARLKIFLVFNFGYS